MRKKHTIRNRSKKKCYYLTWTHQRKLQHDFGHWHTWTPCYEPMCMLISF